MFLNGVQSTAVPGWSVSWLQNNEVLQNVTDNSNNTSGVIFNAQGIKQTGLALPALAGPVQVLSADLIYDAGSNAIYSLSTGTKTWSAPSAGARTSTVAGSRVVFISGSKLVMEPY